MTTSLLNDAFAHHIWATDRLLEACAALTREQLIAETPGTYGPIIATLGHIVASDGWYLSFHRDEPAPTIDEQTSLAEMRSIMKDNGAAWMELLAGEIDSEKDIAERGEGWEFHAPTGFRLAQVIHHGTDHRSQICTALTSLGLKPPEIDVWAYGEATGRTRETQEPPA
jgi:uncharacterized damage-inducible protein DinB